MISTQTAIIITQLPIAIGILWGVFELFLLRKSLTKLLEKLILRK